MISAYCSITEIYMTDLCDDINAESICNTSLLTAISLDPHNIEALYMLANLRFIQERNDESQQYIRKCYTALHQQQQQQHDDNDDDTINSVDDDMINNNTTDGSDISYELRLNICKLLMEHNMNTEALELL